MLFVGSGISYPSGLPNVHDITLSLLQDKWWDHSDGLYYSWRALSELLDESNWVPRLQSFLKVLKSYADDYLQGREKREANYEDLYHMARQLADDEIQEIDNPLIQGSSSDLRQKIKDICRPLPMVREEVTLESLARRSCDFIQCVVREKLSCECVPKGLTLISELARSDQVKDLDIVTLNHDLLIETMLKNEAVPFADGFGQPDGKVRILEPSSYDGNQKIRLVKLHGSINWFYFGRKRDNFEENFYGIPLEDAWHCRDAADQHLLNLGGISVFLTGTYNKIMSYGFGIFAEMHYRFHQLLREHDLIVMSGYGWNDRGVNGRLLEWIYSSTAKRLYLLHKEPERIRDESKSGMWHQYDKLREEGRLIPIKKWLSELSLHELLQEIERTRTRPLTLKVKSQKEEVAELLREDKEQRDL